MKCVGGAVEHLAYDEESHASRVNMSSTVASTSHVNKKKQLYDVPVLAVRK